MTYTTLISCDDLAPHLGDPNWAVFDCRFDLRAPTHGRESYVESHIAGATYADLKGDLASPVQAGITGRHPLPTIDSFAATLSRWGVDGDVQVVVYDDQGGAMAARLWWMLRWLGHDAVAVLDGGWPAWRHYEGSVRSGVEDRPPRTFTPHRRPDLVVDASRVEQLRQHRGFAICDSRSADRYRGENETLDPVAGHIPGALSFPYVENLDAAGRFLASDVLRQRFETRLAGVAGSKVIFYCGSGVTAAHNVLAFAHAGLGEAVLYPGSWSEWITDPQHEVATGPDP